MNEMNPGSIWSMEEVQRDAGMRFMVCAPGPCMTDEFRRVCMEHGFSNFILFSRDIESPGQLKTLCDALHSLARDNGNTCALIAIDQEGGRVQRLPKAMLDTPSAGELSMLSESAIYDTGLKIGKTLRSLGVNFDLAPVLDVDAQNGNPVVGDRSFGKTPDEAAANGVAMYRGLRAGGVLACAKHFPGHGGTHVDTHTDLPSIDISMEELERGPLVPFKAATDAGIPAVMSTHILFPKIDPAHPSTMSREILTGILRQRLGFNGVVITDCLEMGAITKHFGTENAALAALGAGADIALISHSLDKAVAAHGMLCSALENGLINGAEHIRAIRTIRGAEAWLGM